MAMQDHLDRLDDRHRELDDRIRAEMSRPGSDDLSLAALKRRKLALKDEIEHLRRAH